MYVYVNLYFNGRHDTCTPCANEICRNSHTAARKDGLQLAPARRPGGTLTFVEKCVTKSSRCRISLSNVAGLKSSRRERCLLSPVLAGRISGFAPLTNLACFSLGARAPLAKPGVSFTTAALSGAVLMFPELMTALASPAASIALCYSRTRRERVKTPICKRGDGGVGY